MAKANLFQLLTQRRFGPFFATQALGAFNDNVFRNALAIAIAFQAATLSDDQVNFFINLAAGLFTLPFFLFSAMAGQLAEKFEKSRLIRRIKALEIAIMLLAAYGFWLGNEWFLVSLLFLMGLQSALFGPVKYGILPQHLSEEELIGGNGLIGMGTFLAILLGTLVAGLLVAMASPGNWLVSVTVVLVAIVGWLSSRWIPLAPPTAPELRINFNPLTETWRSFGYMRQHRTVFLSVLGISWFWFYGSVYLAQLPNYTRLVLGGSEQVVTLLLALFSIGIASGSLLCERLSGRKVELGLVPFGSIGLTLFGVDLYLARPLAPAAELLDLAAFVATPGAWRVMLDITGLGLFGGFYIVPLYALVQSRSEASHRSRVIAGNNILNAAFMVLAALLAIVLLGAGMSLPQLLLTVALFNIVVALYIYTLVPEFLMRFLVWMLISTLYRVRTRGLEQIPNEGAAIVVANHVSFVDALLIGGTVRRPIRFVMYHKIFRIPILSFIFRTARAIPIAPASEDPQLLDSAMAEIATALDNGELIGLFPEGQITRSGQLNTFRKGIERILQRSPVPVIPVAISNMWGSLFSRRDNAEGRLRLPRRFWARVGLDIAAPMQPGEVSADRLEQHIRSMLGLADDGRKARQP